MEKKHILPLLKIIGVFLFGWILYHIDLTRLLAALSVTKPADLSLALLCIVGICIAKTMRWHTLVRVTGMRPQWKESWQLYFIGIFLGNITPAKVGEFGRAAYLKKKGLPLKIGILLSLTDRISDVVVIVLLGMASLPALGLPEWALLFLATLILAGMIGALLLLRESRKQKEAFCLPASVSSPLRLLTNLTLCTVTAWVFYFLWAVLLARSLGIGVATHILVASFTMTGLFSMLPIAPSGLGTRDATLVLLLAPYGVQAETAVALAMLMFATILLMSVPGGWYWLREKQ